MRHADSLEVFSLKGDSTGKIQRIMAAVVRSFTHSTIFGITWRNVSKCRFGVFASCKKWCFLVRRVVVGEPNTCTLQSAIVFGELPSHTKFHWYWVWALLVQYFDSSEILQNCFPLALPETAVNHDVSLRCFTENGGNCTGFFFRVVRSFALCNTN